MIDYDELKKGVRIILNSQPYEIIEASSMFKGRGHSTLQAKLKNLLSGEIIAKTFHPSDSFEEAAVSKIKVKFLYSHRDRFWFCKEKNPSERFDLQKKQINKAERFLKPNQILEGIVFKDEIINIALPVKIAIKIKEAPPGVKGDRAQGGNKTALLETGAKINVPLFIEEGDIVEINTEKNEYVRRLEKND